MNWEAIGAVGEVVGAAAVVVTLIYVALQIRQNTSSVQASAIDAAVNTFIATRRSVFDDAEISSIFNKGMKNHESLSDDELFRFRLAMHNTLWGIWNIHAQSELTGLSRGVWEAQKPLIRRLISAPGGSWFWATYKNEFEKSFATEIERIIREPK